MALRHRPDGLLRAAPAQAAQRRPDRPLRRDAPDRSRTEPGGAAALRGVGSHAGRRNCRSDRGEKGCAVDADRSRPRVFGDRLGDGLVAAEGEERDPSGAAAAAQKSRRISGGGAMTHLPIEDLEAFALDELPADRTADVRAHLGTCLECARELSWLETERALLARRPSPDTAHLWPGVAARLTHPRRRPRWAWRGAVGAAGGRPPGRRLPGGSPPAGRRRARNTRRHRKRRAPSAARASIRRRWRLSTGRNRITAMPPGCWKPSTTG